MNTIHNILAISGMLLVCIAGCRLLAVRGRSAAALLLAVGAPILSLPSLSNMLLHLLYRLDIIAESSPLVGTSFLRGVSVLSAMGMLAIGVGVFLLARSTAKGN